ncbi:MAG TPA: lysozyme inhibitor LprI family protein [Thermoanaerobaculia bacterium]|nr:lysozyme inhibitor LprI family protein [Thermoanaerobaculia bacterium]
MKITNLPALIAAIAALLALCLAASLYGQNDFGEQEAQALCAKLKDYHPGPQAQPTEADHKLFAAESETCTGYVYGPGKARDYDKGRRCCLVKGCDRELAMIFANGWGVPRDYDAAVHFLCQAGEIAPAEQWGMLGHVQEMRRQAQPQDLDYCEWVTSGHGMSWCQGLEIDHRAPDWDRRVETVSSSLPAAARAALKTLRKAADTFAEADGGLTALIHYGGTIYSSQVLAGEQAQTEAFLTALESYAVKRAPAATAAGFESADRALNAAYQQQKIKVKADDKELQRNQVGEDTLRDAQRAWIPYRDAWKTFYRLRWKGSAAPEALDREIATALTTMRAEELRKVGSEE